MNGQQPPEKPDGEDMTPPEKPEGEAPPANGQQPLKSRMVRI